MPSSRQCEPLRAPGAPPKAFAASGSPGQQPERSSRALALLEPEQTLPGGAMSVASRSGSLGSHWRPHPCPAEAMSSATPSQCWPSDVEAIVAPSFFDILTCPALKSLAPEGLAMDPVKSSICGFSVYRTLSRSKISAQTVLALPFIL